MVLALTILLSLVALGCVICLTIGIRDYLRRRDKKNESNSSKAS